MTWAEEWPESALSVSAYKPPVIASGLAPRHAAVSGNVQNYSYAGEEKEKGARTHAHTHAHAQTEGSCAAVLNAMKFHTV